MSLALPPIFDELENKDREPAERVLMLIKLFLYMTKMSRQKLKYLENEKSF